MDNKQDRWKVQLSADSKVLKFLNFVYQTDFNGRNGCLLAWGLILSPLILILMALAAIFVVPILWLHNKAETRRLRKLKEKELTKEHDVPDEKDGWQMRALYWLGDKAQSFVEWCYDKWQLHKMKFWGVAGLVFVGMQVWWAIANWRTFLEFWGALVITLVVVGILIVITIFIQEHSKTAKKWLSTIFFPFKIIGYVFTFVKVKTCPVIEVVNESKPSQTSRADPHLGHPHV